MVGRSRHGQSSRNCVSSPQLQVRKCTNRVANYDSTMLENVLKLGRSFSAAVPDEIGLAAHIHRIEGAEKPLYTAAPRAQFLGNCCLKQVDSPVLWCSCEKVRNSVRVQITGRWIYSQCVPVSRGRHTLGSADRSQRNAASHDTFRSGTRNMNALMRNDKGI